MPPVERWYVLSSVVRRYISFIVSGTSMNYLLLYHQWYGDISLSCLQWNVGMCYRQWYGDISLSSSVVWLYISFIVSGTSMKHFFSISSMVRWYISFIPLVERRYVLSSVVRRYISFIVSGTSMNYISLYHQWYGDISLSCLQWNVGMCYCQWYGGISLSSSVVRR